MTINRKRKTTTNKDARTLNLALKEGENENRKLAEVKLSPTIMNTIITQAFTKPLVGDINLEEAVAVMNEKAKKINDGDLSELEATLAAQAVSLNSIFNVMASRSADNIGHYLKTVEIYLRLALKAQAQCVRTIEVLAAIKNPPIVYAKQANIAQGHQQINNNSSPTHTGKTINSSNELLSEINHATLDTRGTIETSNINQEMAAVETVNGSKDTGR